MRDRKTAVSDALGTDFLAAVENNTAIADAISAGDYTLCTYLMKMREYYRWHSGLAFDTRLDSEKLGQWIRETETHWESIEENPFTDLPIAGQRIPPLETEAINQHLLKHRLVYSAGIGQYGKVHFFLARLESEETRSNFKILISSEEYVRDLVSPVAMTLNNTIFVRKQALQRLIWERVQENAWHGAPTPLAKSLRGWNFEDETEHSLIQAADHFTGVFILHEIGEIRAGEQLGEVWEQILGSHIASRLELQLRALRDTLADYLVTLPELLKSNDARQIHFYFGMLSPLRKKMLNELIQAYQQWCETQDTAPVTELISKQKNQWLLLCQSVIQAYEHKPDSHQVIEQLLEQHLEHH